MFQQSLNMYKNSTLYYFLSNTMLNYDFSNLISAELFPLDARAELTGLANCFGNLSIFLVVKTFPALSQPEHLGLSGSYWLYFSVCILNIFFGLCFLPETKGKHLEEINKEFESKSRRNDAHSSTNIEEKKLIENIDAKTISVPQTKLDTTLD